MPVAHSGESITSGIELISMGLSVKAGRSLFWFGGDDQPFFGKLTPEVLDRIKTICLENRMPQVEVENHLPVLSSEVASEVRRDILEWIRCRESRMESANVIEEREVSKAVDCRRSGDHGGALGNPHRNWTVEEYRRVVMKGNGTKQEMAIAKAYYKQRSIQAKDVAQAIRSTRKQQLRCGPACETPGGRSAECHVRGIMEMREWPDEVLDQWVVAADRWMNDDISGERLRTQSHQLYRGIEVPMVAQKILGKYASYADLVSTRYTQVSRGCSHTVDGSGIYLRNRDGSFVEPRSTVSIAKRGRVTFIPTRGRYQVMRDVMDKKSREKVFRKMVCDDRPVITLLLSTEGECTEDTSIAQDISKAAEVMLSGDEAVEAMLSETVPTTKQISLVDASRAAAAILADRGRQVVECRKSVEASETAMMGGTSSRIMSSIESSKCKHGDGFHFPHDPNCVVCAKSNMQVRPRKRTHKTVEVGGICIDIAVNQKQYVLIGVCRGEAPCTLAIGLKSKTTESIEKGILRLLLEAEHLYGTPAIKRIHSDREPGLLSNRHKLAQCGILVTSTEGRAPQSNGVAEAEVRVVSRAARAAVIACNGDSSIWKEAMAYGAMLRTLESEKHQSSTSRIKREDMLPFGSRVLYKRGPLTTYEKLEERGTEGIYLGVAADVPEGSIVGKVEDGIITRTIVVTSVKPVLEDGKPCWLPTISKATTTRCCSWDQTSWVECDKCHKWRLIDDQEADDLADGTFHCEMLRGGDCDDPEDPRAWDDDRRPNEKSDGPQAARRGVEYRAQFGLATHPSSTSVKSRRAAFLMSVNKIRNDYVSISEILERVMMPQAGDGEQIAMLAQGMPDNQDWNVSPGCTVESDTWQIQWEKTSVEGIRSTSSAYVYREIPADEAVKRKSYVTTLGKELGKYLENKAVAWPLPVEKLSLRAAVYRAQMLYGEKGVELAEDDPDRKDKARLVVNGNVRINADGSITLERVMNPAGAFWAPTAALSSARLCASYAAISDSQLMTIDLESAYLQTTYGDDESYLELPEALIEHMPAEWRKRYRVAQQASESGRAVFPIKKALYGLARSGTDFINAWHETLLSNGWRRMNHDQAVFYRHIRRADGKFVLAIMVSYVDDILAAIPRCPEAQQVWEELRASWKFDKEAPSNRFLGIVLRQSTGKIILNQAEYALNRIASFEKSTGVVVRGRKNLPDALHEMGDEGAPREPAPTMHRSALGGLMYLVRGSRPEVCRAVNMTAGRVASWSSECESFMIGVLGFIKANPQEIQYRVSNQPMSSWSLQAHSDSNHIAPKSTSGHCLYLINSITGERLLLDWVSRRQTVCTLSSTESETLALVSCARHAIVWAEVIALFHATEPVSDLATVPCPTVNLFCDNLAAVLGDKRGFSKSLIHMSRAYGCSIAWLKQMLDREVFRLHYVSTHHNAADCLTKIVSQPTPMLRLMGSSKTSVMNPDDPIGKSVASLCPQDPAGTLEEEEGEKLSSNETAANCDHTSPETPTDTSPDVPEEPLQRDIAEAEVSICDARFSECMTSEYTEMSNCGGGLRHDGEEASLSGMHARAASEQGPERGYEASYRESWEEPRVSCPVRGVRKRVLKSSTKTRDDRTSYVQKRVHFSQDTSFRESSGKSQRRRAGRNTHRGYNYIAHSQYPVAGGAMRSILNGGGL